MDSYTIAKNHLDKTISYDDYKAHVETRLAKGEATGNTQNEMFLEYSKLGLQRMKRWEKTVKLSDAQKEAIKAISKQQTWLVIAEGWCGDAATALPIMEKISTLNSNISFQVILRDTYPDLINAFLTNGGQSIPKLIAIDSSEDKILYTWGPRSIAATKLVEEEKAKNDGEFTAESKTTLQQWYNKDKGQNIIADLMTLLQKNDSA
ncbi:MAG: thioredoxin family protein [Psychroflexus sp.]|nr:thioredoxin family protein [Psychroflexus sp.]MDN6310884.1 thioredoxin family protein [Psychroflexus sp.]